MTLSMHRLSVPVFVRGLTILAELLRKGEAHAGGQGLDPATLVAGRLAADMLPLSGQVQRVSDTSKLAIERLTGQASPRFEDNETTFAELQARIANTIAYLNGIDAAAMDAAAGRTVTLRLGSGEQQFSGEDYLLTFALPNFFFHVTTAYDILRHLGVPLGKRDYLGRYS